MIDTIISNDMLLKTIDQVLKKVDDNMDTFVDVFPKDCSRDNVYPGQNIEHGWTQSFWTGMLWLAYELTDDVKYKELASHHTDLFKYRVDGDYNMDTHDLGFLYTLSCVADYKLTGSELAKETALNAADKLTIRWKEKGEFIQAWGSITDNNMYRLIIDCYMNLPLLYWASEVTGDDKYADMATKHAHTARKVIIRDDNSTFHTHYFNPETGAPTEGITAQGYSDDSCWSRGQAWAVYGFALCYKYTGDPVFIEEYVKVTDYFIDHLPEDLVAYWDLIFVDGDEERDSSAASIAVCGMLEMVKYLEGDKKQKYQEMALKITASLIKYYTTFESPTANGLLFHGVYSKPGGGGVDEMQIWGDYYFMEALMRLKNVDWKLYWQTMKNDHRYYKDSKGSLHVPKLELKDILVQVVNLGNDTKMTRSSDLYNYWVRIMLY